MIDWDKITLTRKEYATIGRIVDRAMKVYPEGDRMSLMMSLEACTILCPMDWEGLEKAKGSDLGHDVFGIDRYIDKETGELTECFLPRYAQKVTA